MSRLEMSIRCATRFRWLLLAFALSPLATAQAQGPRVVVAGGPVVLEAPAAVEPGKAALKLSLSERQILTQASRFGFEQVTLGQNGTVRATDPRVRAFAQALTSTWADETWNVLATGRRAGTVLPKKISFQQRQALAALERHPAELYDWALVSLIAREHETFLAALDAKERRHDSKAMRAWTDKVRPIVKRDLKTARDLVADLTPPAG